MEAKLKIAEFDCMQKSFSASQRKEESCDAVVPDTMPDIAELLCCRGVLLIRSKDVSAGRIRIEANLPTTVFYLSEDGRLCSVNMAVPFYISVEDSAIADGSAAVAELKLHGLEAHTLNPRKIHVRAEIEARLNVYEPSRFSMTEGVDDCCHIRPHIISREISFVTAVTEKSFALADELPMPPAGEGVGEVILAGCECIADETKTVGSKLILKGRVKSSLLMINGDSELCRLEPVTEFSQIVELGAEAENSLCAVNIIPSGSYVQQSPEAGGRVALEYHLVAQVTCYNTFSVSCMDDAYSNSYPIELGLEEKDTEHVVSLGFFRENLRHLFETAYPVSEVLYCACGMGELSVDGEKMIVPLSASAVCKGPEGMRSEKRRVELAVRIPPVAGKPWILSGEVCDCALLPVPGGLELRVDVSVEICETRRRSICSVCSLAYDDEKPLDNSEKPSLVLLCPGTGEELWNIARENCSCQEAILAANGLESPLEAQGRLILVPKTW